MTLASSSVSRSAGITSLPARFQLAAGHPCRRGYSPAERARYLARLSRPLLDRINLHIEIPTLSFTPLPDAAPGESSAVIRGLRPAYPRYFKQIAEAVELTRP